jgi:hypothetical protein
MHIGDLSRARISRGLLDSSVSQAMVALLAIGFLVAGWLAWPSTKADANAEHRTVAGTASRSPVLPQVADAVPAATQTIPAPVAAPSKEFPDAMRPGTSETATPEPAPLAEQPLSPAPAQIPPDVTSAVTKQAALPAEPAPADDLVDLNTASFEQLNSLPGAGPVGRAIIKGRPYASAEDLVKKKVLRRPIYEKIKDQVTVR